MDFDKIWHEDAAHQGTLFDISNKVVHITKKGFHGNQFHNLISYNIHFNIQ